MERWFVKREELVLGPYSEDELQGYVARGKVTAADLVSRDGKVGWTTIYQVPQFRDAATHDAVKRVAALPPEPESETPPAASVRAWYVARGSQVAGPLDLDALRRALVQGKLKLDDKVCEVGGTAWTAIAYVDVLSDLVSPFGELQVVPDESHEGLTEPELPTKPTLPTAVTPSVLASTPAPITWKVLGSAVRGTLGIVLRGGGGGGGEEWNSLEQRLGMSGWRKFLVNLVIIATLASTFLGLVVLPVALIKSRNRPSSSRTTASVNSSIVSPPVIPSTSVPETPRPRFGGGYEGARWGSSQTEVIARLGGTVTQQTDTHLTLLRDERPINCWFHQGTLYRVETDPGLADATDVEVALRLLRERYGEGEVVPNMVDSRYGAPLQLVRWGDGETAVTFSMWDPAPAMQSGMEYRVNFARISYESIQLSTARAQALQREQQEQRANDVRARELELRNRL